MKKSMPFHNRILIDSPVPVIYNYLLDPTNLTRLHPLIVGVERLPSGREGSARVVIQDKITVLGFIPVYKKYEASFTAIELDRQLLLETFTSPGIHIRNTITLSRVDGKTEVEEQVQVEVPAWVAGFVMKQIRYSHGEMLQRLKALIEA